MEEKCLNSVVFKYEPRQNPMIVGSGWNTDVFFEIVYPKGVSEKDISIDVEISAVDCCIVKRDGKLSCEHIPISLKPGQHESFIISFSDISIHAPHIIICTATICYIENGDVILEEKVDVKIGGTRIPALVGAKKSWEDYED